MGLLGLLRGERDEMPWAVRILVTGCAGYIGSNLAFRLREKGLDVVGLDSFEDYYSVAIKRMTAERLVEAGVEMVEANLAGGATGDEVGALASYLDRADAVVHFAGQPGLSASTPWEDYNRNNVVATHRLLEAAKAAGVKRFVNISSSSVYGLRAMDSEIGEPKPASWYGETKLAAEMEVMGANRLSGFPACSLRLFSVYGERERPEKLFPRLIRAIANDEEFPLFEGAWEHQRSFTYVGDICDAVIACLENWDRAEGEIFNVGTDKCFTTGEAIETVQRIMGKEAKLKLLPPRPGDQAATHANIEKIRTRLGWQPRTTLRSGLERTVKWYLDEVHGKIE